MNENGIVRSGDVIAAEINGIKRQTEKAVRGVMLSAAMDIGKLLIEAKSVVPHGEWGAWLEENVSYSTTTANDMMRLYTEYGDSQIPIDGGPSNEELFGAIAPSKALALLALPEQDRRDFVQANNVDDMSVRTLREEIARVKAEKEAAEAAKAAAEAEAEGRRDAAEAAMRAKAAAEEKLADAQKKQDAAVRAAKNDEAAKVKKQLDAVNEKLKKAEESAAEQKKQISMLQDQIRAAEAEEASAERETEESPELIALREEKAQLEKKLLAADPTMARFGVLIGQYQAQFAQLLQMAQDAENRDMHKKMMDVLTRVQASFTAALAEE